jgi:hypothetical protein
MMEERRIADEKRALRPVGATVLVTTVVALFNSRRG